MASTPRWVAFLATDGVEQIELDQPWQAVLDAGGKPELISPSDGEIQAFQHLDKGARRSVDRTVAVICHGPWTLVEADVVRGRRITSWPSLRTRPASDASVLARM